MKIDLKELEALARAATPGPWLHRHDPGNRVGCQHGVKLPGELGAWIADCLDNADRSTAGGVAGERNAAFIAAANPAAVLELIALASAPAVNLDVALPEADYPAGVDGMLGEDCWSRALVEQFGASCVTAERERAARLALQWSNARNPDNGGHALRNYAQALRDGVEVSERDSDYHWSKAPAPLDLNAITKRLMDETVTEAIEEGDDDFRAGKNCGILAMKMAVKEALAAPQQHSQAALSDEQIKVISKEVGMLVSHDGKYMRSVGTHGGMNVDDGIAFARAILAAQRAASVEAKPVGRVKRNAVPGGGWMALVQWSGIVPADGADVYTTPPPQPDSERDAARLDLLEQMGNEPEGMLLHDGGDFTGRRGLGLRRIGRTLRQAIDAMSAPQDTEKGGA